MSLLLPLSKFFDAWRELDAIDKEQSTAKNNKDRKAGRLNKGTQEHLNGIVRRDRNNDRVTIIRTKHLYNVQKASLPITTRGSNSVTKKPVLIRRYIEVLRTPGSLWEDKGWQKNGNTCTGFYSCDGRRWYGEIVWGLSGLTNCTIYDPPSELSKHKHSACFAHRGNGKWSVHFSTPPQSIDSTIMTVEKILNECLYAQRNRKGGRT